MRKQIAAANWKMNCTLQQANALLDELMATPHETDADHIAVFGVPFPYLMLVKEISNLIRGYSLPSSHLTVSALRAVDLLRNDSPLLMSLNTTWR